MALTADKNIEPLGVPANGFQIVQSTTNGDTEIDDHESRIVALEASSPAITTKTASYTALISDQTILCDATSGELTITLPAASGNSALRYNIKKTDSTVNAVIIDGNASETIDGLLTATISTQYDSIAIVCDGTNWFII